MGQANNGGVIGTVHKAFVRLCTCCTSSVPGLCALHQDSFNDHKKAVECVITELRVTKFGMPCCGAACHVIHVTAFYALLRLTQPLLDCILRPTQHPYDPGILPSSATYR